MRANEDLLYIETYSEYETPNGKRCKSVDVFIAKTSNPNQPAQEWVHQTPVRHLDYVSDLLLDPARRAAYDEYMRA